MDVESRQHVIDASRGMRPVLFQFSLRPYACLWMLIAMTAPPWAQASDSSDQTDSLAAEAPVETPEVVISATRTREPAPTIPGSPTILTREDLDKTPFRGGHQVDDLLRYVPGVQPSTLSSRYNHPTAQTVSVRGLGGRRALVLLDGVPLNDGFGGWINWGLVPDNIERIEVVPGGGSNLYGTWAMGGVIHILTKPAEAGKHASFEGIAGNLDTYTTSLLGQYGTDRAGISLGYRWFHSNGFVTVPPDQRGPVDTKDDSRHQQFWGSLRLSVTPRATLTVVGNYFREDRSFGTPLSLATRTIGTASLGVDGRTVRGDRWETKIFGQWQTFRNLTSRVTPSPTNRLSEVRDRIQTVPSNDYGGLAQYTIHVMPGHRLVIGGDARAIIGQSEEEIFPAAPSTGRSLAKGKQVGWGLFGEWIAQPWDALVVVPSFRMDWWKNFDGRVEAVDGMVTFPRDNVETALNPKLAVQYRITDRLTSGASVYQAFRAPTLNELYRGFRFGDFELIPNSDLVPERLWGTEANLEIGLLPNRRASLRVTGHYDEVKDQIISVSLGPLSKKRQNVGRTRTIGAEVDALFRPLETLSLKLGYAFADSTIRSFPQDPSLEGNRVPNVSRHQVVGGVTVGHPDTLQVTLLVRYLSRQFADDTNDQPIADFVVLDASLRRNLGKRARLFLDAENVTDRQYVATQTGSIKTLGTPLLVTGGVRLEY